MEVAEGAAHDVAPSDEGEDLDDLEEEEEEQVSEDDFGGSGEAEDGSDQASLEQLLAQRAATRPAAGDSDEDTADILSFTSEPEPASLDVEVPSRKVTPIKHRQEFVCARCHLVKPRVQLADAERWLCKDCI